MYVLAEFSTSNVAAMATLINVLEGISITKISLEFFDEYVYIQEMDSAHIMLASIAIRPGCVDPDALRETVRGVMINDANDTEHSRGDARDDPGDLPRDDENVVMPAATRKRKRVDTTTAVTAAADHYECHRECTVRVNTASLKALFTSAKRAKSPYVRLSVLAVNPDGEPERLGIAYSYGATGTEARSNVLIQYADEETVTAPVQNVTHHISMPSTHFLLAVTDVGSTAGDAQSITISIYRDDASVYEHDTAHNRSGEYVRLTARGDFGDSTLCIRPNAERGVFVRSAPNVTVPSVGESVAEASKAGADTFICSQTYMAKCLEALAKMSATAPTVSLYLGTLDEIDADGNVVGQRDSPLLTSFTLDRLGKITFYLAPRVEDS